MKVTQGVCATEKRSGSIRKKLALFFSFVCVYFVLNMCFLHFFVSPIIIKTGNFQIDELSYKALNESVNEIMSGDVCYDDLIHIVTDGEGKISMIQANSIIINLLCQKIVQCATIKLFDKVYEPLYIPVGAFTGITALSSWGPKISMNLVPYGNVKCWFESSFAGAGINQTIHKIYLKVQSNITAVLPMNKIKRNNTVEVLVAESLIVGDIPDTYLMAEEKSDLLNMVD